MKDYERLTVGETKALTPEDIAKYALSEGKKVFDKNTEAVLVFLGTEKIKKDLAALQLIDDELNGKPTL